MCGCPARAAADPRTQIRGLIEAVKYGADAATGAGDPRTQIRGLIEASASFPIR